MSGLGLCCFECGKEVLNISELTNCPCKNDTRETKIARNKQRIKDKLKDKRIDKNSTWEHDGMIFHSIESFSEHIDTCQNISSTRASPYELVCDDCGKIIEIILSFKTIQKYTCSCKVEKYIKENSIVGVTIQNSTHLILRYDTGKENRVEVNSEQLEMVRDYYKDKYQKEVIAKQEEEQKEINRLRDENIFGLTTKHKIGWSIFFILAPTAIYFIRKYSKKLKKEQPKNLKEEIQNKFKLWRLNMGLSVLFYAVSFYLLQQFINKWIRPNIKWCLENHENTIILSVTGILGVLFLVDSYISSELKTPLQRLAIKIENADIDEKEKKELLSKTQWSNENFKETLKRFGLLTIAGALIKLLGKAFDEKFIANFCYVIPLAFGGWQIYKIGERVAKIKLHTKSNTSS